MRINLQENTWPQIEEYLKRKTSIVLPVGSTEQHGPTGILGIDYLSAHSVAQAVGEITQTLVAPPLCFGMALHHMGFPGTISLTPITYIQVLTEIVQSLAKHGFNKFTFINGHGGNIAPITAAMSQIKQDKESYVLKLVNWWHMPEVQAYEKKIFGDENGFHATCGEISVTMHTHPEAYALIPNMNFSPTIHQHHWPMGPTEFRKYFPDGRMGSNPSLASPYHGEKILKLAIDSICQKIEQ